jgi:hypothetical protein
MLSKALESSSLAAYKAELKLKGDEIVELSLEI